MNTFNVFLLVAAVLAAFFSLQAYFISAYNRGVLVDREILAAVERRAIIIEPFVEKCLGTNSYDVHLAPILRVYKSEYKYEKVYCGGPVEVIPTDYLPLDARVPRDTTEITIPHDGYVLQPGKLYLASTTEYTESLEHVPVLNGRSSIGRLGLSIHVTAGTGDVGFRGYWTMELFVVEPLRIYAGMPIGQLLWLTASGKPKTTYDKKKSAKYGGQSSSPQASKIHEDFDDEKTIGTSGGERRG